MSTPKRPKQLSRKTIHTSKWINLHRDKVELPGGRIVDEMYVVDYPHESVGVVVVNGQQEILLEYAWRYHTGKDGWEIPAGGIDDGESVVEAGKRETFEETGYTITDGKHIYTYDASNGSTNEVLHIVHGKVATDTQQSYDTNEVKKVEWFSEKRIKEMIRTHKIHDGHSLIGLMMYLGKFSI